jgi:hypothetical protein
MSAVVFVVVLMALVRISTDVPVLWASLVLVAAVCAWFLRQAVLPDRDAPRGWRVRNALGCLFVGMGVPVVIMLVASDSLFPGAGPDKADQQGLGLLVLLAILAGLGAVVTLVWGLVNWLVSGLTRS